MKKMMIMGTLLMLLITLRGYSQQSTSSKQQDSVRRENRIEDIQKRIQVDASKAKEILRIQDAYKMRVKEMMKNLKLDEHQKRQGIDSLIRLKNKQLILLLTPEQQEKLIPIKERKNIVQPKHKQP